MPVTLAVLLEELKEVDQKTSDELEKILNSATLCAYLRLRDAKTGKDEIIQGCIQRACERREWIWHHGHGPEMGYVATVNHVNIVKGDSATEVLLSAYIAAVKEEKR